MVASIDEESRIGCDTDNSAGSYPTVGEGTRPNQIGVRRSVYMYPVLGVACAQCIIWVRAVSSGHPFAQPSPGSLPIAASSLLGSSLGFYPTLSKRTTVTPSCQQTTPAKVTFSAQSWRVGGLFTLIWNQTRPSICCLDTSVPSSSVLACRP